MPHTRTSPLTARMRVGTLPGIAILVALALPSAQVVAQTSPPASSVFYFCYVKGSGTVYRIKVPGVPDDCHESQTPFSWTDGANALLMGTAAGGDLSGNYPSPSVAKIAGIGVSTTAPTNGQFLKFDGVNWAPATLPAVSGTSANTPNTLVQRDANGGFAAGALTLSGKFTHSSDDGFVSGGGQFLGQIPASGLGNYMMWYPGKSAFRAGESGGNWQDADVGVYSVAFGQAPKASGTYSLAIGKLALATGLAAVALGNEPQATEAGAIAIGDRARATGDHSVAIGTFATTNGKRGAIALADASQPNGFFNFLEPTADNQFMVRAGGGTIIYSAGNLSAGVSLAPGGGAWASVSDVKRKNFFRDVDADDVLAKVARMPVREWSYKSQDSTVRHLGPTAQDFYAAFKLDKSDTTITTTDIDGVALLAIQALERRTKELRERTAELRERTAQVSALEARLAEVERQLALLFGTTTSPKQASPHSR